MSKGYYNYKGFPLMKLANVIYYGNMSDEHVTMIQILNKKKVNDIYVASKIKVYYMSTDMELSPSKAITKSDEKESLYEALDLANNWLMAH